MLDPDAFKFNWKNNCYRQFCGGEAEVRFVEWHLPPPAGGNGSGAGSSGRPSACPIREGRHVALKVHHAPNGRGGFRALIDEIDVQEEGGPASTCHV